MYILNFGSLDRNEYGPACGEVRQFGQFLITLEDLTELKENFPGIDIEKRLFELSDLFVKAYSSHLPYLTHWVHHVIADEHARLQ